MPPVPTVIPQHALDLLATLQKHELEVENQITRLRNLSGPAALQQELANLVRDGVKQLENEIEDIRLFADDCDPDAVRSAMLHRLKKHEEQFRIIQSSSRRSILQSKQNLDAQMRHERELLFAPSTGKIKKNTEEYELRQRDSSSSSAILNTSNSITTSLHRTTAIMAQELERSQISTKVLSESSQSLQRTNSEYRSFSDLLRTSHAIITRMEQSDLVDKFLLWAGVLVFAIVVLWILKKRTWDVGISWAEWVGGIFYKLFRLLVGNEREIVRQE